MNRRTFLRAAGVSLSLPWLEALASNAPPPRRMVLMCAPLGVHPEDFFPEKAGKEYAPSRYLDVLGEFRNEFSVMSGLSHPEIPSAHDSHVSFLTGAHHRGYLRAGFRNTISLDQLAAEQIGGETRVPSLCVGESGLSWTRSGVRVPSNHFPASVFGQLFLEGRPQEVEAQRRRLRQGQSILDQIRDQAKALDPALSAGDREKVDEYFTSVRELEQQLTRSEEWSRKPKPKVEAKAPRNPEGNDFIGQTRAWFDLAHLAFQTDSTRLMTIDLLGTSSVPPVPGVTQGHHDLSHHGKDPEKIEQLRKVETELMKALRDLLAKLKGTPEAGGCLLDRTMVFFSSNLGNASNHATTNLPVLLAGGGFKHGQHLAYDLKSPPPLCNLFVSMLQRMGLPFDSFGSSTGALTGLEMAGEK
jgi:hypothetical protein